MKPDCLSYKYARAAKQMRINRKRSDDLYDKILHSSDFHHLKKEYSNVLVDFRGSESLILHRLA